ncbi:MAG TPA: SUMF1/EgtB/PvdO family nonheme iron enzyme [Pyrinomonadaceae bacterium]|nr:SUMF1/EgtB/PvdO family nonheme iron enzyme [Pyrinomonadaceae bacterium]
MLDSHKTEIARLMHAARADTLALFDLAREEDLHRSPGGGFRPIIWHLAHVGVFEAYWLVQRVGGEKSPDERYERVFDPIKTPREQSKELPSRGEMESYLACVREGSLRCLERIEFDERDPLLGGAYVFDLVLEHERQHQETLAYLLHLLDPQKKTLPRQSLESAPAARDAFPDISHRTDQPSSLSVSTTSEAMVTVPAGSFMMGSPWDSFAYDNELPPHEVFVPEFRLDRLLTTNEEYARFITAGGYRRREWWSDEGWSWREREGWECPLYWSREGETEWRARRMFDEGLIDGRHPVVGVSWYEAEAYARFVRKRLPTEAEWEKAASWDAAREKKRRFAWGDDEPSVTDPARANFGNHFWGTTLVGSFPKGASPYGCLDMSGNVWEWTADEFKGFDGFKAFPYREYSEEWFDGDHRVLKGGSWATRSSVLRTSFRNFFRRHFRIAFAGIRCACDL